MTVYEDEWAFWDDIAGKYIFKHADTDRNVTNVIEAAGVYADLMVIARRKRRAAKIPEGDMPRVSMTAASFMAAGASR
ncbi:hypothetical protein KKQ10_21415 [Pseudomonas sp. MG-9]|uniref:Uncharacterized protein n=1 Tax=Pseudomonas serboccidentalis TaxID=2964670 RepID=A0ABY7ZIH9_9PSED|nr:MULTISPECIES: hypothetical protein [Pseudomonas]MBT9267445.1 hypothetical protein [Pseudomonas sp. MG-9]WDR38588.1 hypothetical protein NN484_12855 [Pseudomonas serboccidentalis]